MWCWPFDYITLWLDLILAQRSNLCFFSLVRHCVRRISRLTGWSIILSGDFVCNACDRTEQRSRPCDHCVGFLCLFRIFTNVYPQHTYIVCPSLCTPHMGHDGNAKTIDGIDILALQTHHNQTPALSFASIANLF